MEAELSAERGNDGTAKLNGSDAGTWRTWADERIKKHDVDMYFGNGKPAITVRMDRVERFVEKASKLMTAILLLLVGAILTGIVDVIVRAHHL